MKRVLAAGGLLLAMFVFASAQKTTDTAAANFAGTWELDIAKSTIPSGRGGMVTGQTTTVTQDAKTITLASETKSDGPRPVPAQSHTYNLDGTEGDTELRMMGNTAPAKAKAKSLPDGKLELTMSATIETQMGSFAFTQTDVLELADGGKTLKIRRSRTTPRGVEESAWVYSKK